MDYLRALLSGKKTIGLGIITIAIGVTEGILGLDVPNVVVGDDWVGWIMAGLMAITMRQGIAKP